MVEPNHNRKYLIRAMEDKDIPQALEIDREAFPTQWPYPTYSSFKQELRNKLARYIVAAEPVGNPADTELKYKNEKPGKSNGRFHFLKHIFNIGKSSESIETVLNQYIIGFTGFWLMMKEAHITTIAVRSKYRRLGIGETMMFSLIDSAAAMNAEIITLEVRISNKNAQQLYRKFGFIDSGIRRSYYTDNNEDALIMTTEKLDSAAFVSNLDELKKAHIHKWGHSPSYVNI